MAQIIEARPVPRTGFVRRLVATIRARRPTGTLDAEAMRDAGVLAAYQDYAVSNGMASGEPRRLYRVTTVALGTFPH